MSVTNDLIDYVVTALETHAVFGTDWTVYRVSDWFKDSGNMKMPCLYVHFNDANTVLHASHYEYNVTVNVELYIQSHDEVTDTVERDNIEAVYYYGEELVDCLVDMDTTGEYYINDVRLVQMPVKKANMDDTLGAMAQITFGSRKNA